MSESIIRYLGIGIEGETDDYGDDIPAMVHVDITDADLDTPDDALLNYEGGMGRSLRTVRTGPYIPNGSISYALDINTIAYLLYLALGYGEEVDPDSYDYKYIFKNQQDIRMPGATFHVAKDQFIHSFLGSVVNELSISVDDGFVEGTIDVISQKDKDNGVPEDDLTMLDLPDEYPLAFHEVNFKMADAGSETANVDVESLDLTISNNIDDDAGIILGDRFPKYMIAQELDISIDIDISFNNTDELYDFWGVDSDTADGPTACDTPTEKEIEIIMEACDDYGELNINLPRAIIENVDQQPSGRDRLVQTVNITSLLDTSAEAELIATLENNVELDETHDWLVDSTTS